MSQEPEPPTNAPRFADTIWKFENAQCDFMQALERAGFEELVHYARIGWDHYDVSVEFFEVNNDVRLSPEQQKIIFDAGFVKILVSHKDGWETHYTSCYPERPCPVRGWRRRWVNDPTAKTTCVSNAGYYEISFWPESWGQQNWRETGYARVVPDPLEVALPTQRPEITDEGPPVAPTGLVR